MKITLPSIIFLFYQSVCFAQRLDSAKMNPLFVNQLEKDAFFEYSDQNDEAVTLLLASDSKKSDIETYNKRLNEFIVSLQKKTNESRSKKSLRYVKKIFDHTHKTFLTKYEEQTKFNQIFKSGIYNCVTACILYAEVFDKIGVPYIVKKTPSHVYLVAFPKTKQVLVETTNPSEGFSQFSYEYKDNFVQNLLTNKLIDKKEYDSSSTIDLFNKYYFIDESISKRELIALQYVNESLYLNDAGDPLASIGQMEKAFYLYETSLINKSLGTLITGYLAKEKYEDWHQIELLQRLSELDSTVYTNDFLLSEFKRFTHESYIKRGLVELYDSAYSYLKNSLRRKTLINDMSYHYYYEKSRKAYNKGLYTRALLFSQSAYGLNSSNDNAELLLINSLKNAFENETTGQITSISERLKKEYPSLMGNNIFGGIYIDIALNKIKGYFENSQAQNGKALMTEIEKILISNPGYIYDRDLLGKTYATAGTYYFKQDNYSAAKKLLNKGLKLAPGNLDIAGRLYYLEN